MHIVVLNTVVFEYSGFRRHRNIHLTSSYFPSLFFPADLQNPRPVSYLILPYLILPYAILSSASLPYLIISYTILNYLNLSYVILSYLRLSSTSILLYLIKFSTVYCQKEEVRFDLPHTDRSTTAKENH